MYDILTAHATACIQEMYLHGYWSRRIQKLFTTYVNIKQRLNSPLSFFLFVLAIESHCASAVQHDASK